MGTLTRLGGIRRILGHCLIAICLTGLVAGPPAAVGAGRPAIAAEQTHEVQPGETLSEIAERYGVTVAAIVRANDLSSGDVIRVGQVLVIPTGGGAAPAPASRRVTVREGQTLWQIAEEHGTTPAAIMEANGLTNSELIQPGQELTLPGESDGSAGAPAPRPTAAPRRVTVREGQTLWAIAADHDTTPAAIMEANGLADSELIRPGQELIIPAGTPGGAPAPAGRPTAAPPARVTVREGQTLWQIAEEHDTTPAAIMEANGLTNSELIRPGQELTVPGGAGAGRPTPRPAATAAPTPAATPRPVSEGTRVTVQPGQTLWLIAREHGVTPSAIAEANGIPENGIIRPGQVLSIPGAGRPHPSARADRPAPTATPTPAPAPRPAPTAAPPPTRPAAAGRVFKVTMYCLQGRMANGEYVHQGAASADWSVLPLGTRIQVEGLGQFTIKDHYDRDLGALRLDIWEPSCARALQWGIRNVTVTVVG